MSVFSPDRKSPPARFSPGPGQIGVQAAMRAGRGSQGDGTPPRARGLRTDLPGATNSARASGGAASPASPPETSDYRHLVAAAQWENMRKLGREIAFGNSLILNGDYRSILPNGQRPFDWFLDLP